MKPIHKNQQLTQLVSDLKKLSIEQEAKLWKRIASDLEKPTRQRRTVNVYKIDQYSKDNEVVIVPGKVLGTGELNHNVTVAALNFSEEAKEKIASKGKAISIRELMQQNPKGAKIKLLG